LADEPAEAERLLAETEELVRIFKASLRTATGRRGRENVER
jgi:hypothetical protein